MLYFLIFSYNVFNQHTCPLMYASSDEIPSCISVG